MGWSMYVKNCLHGGVHRVSADKQTVYSESLGCCNNSTSPNFQKKITPVSGPMQMWEKWEALLEGGDPNIPQDTGFALKGWREVSVDNAAIYIIGNVGIMCLRTPSGCNSEAVASR